MNGSVVRIEMDGTITIYMESPVSWVEVDGTSSTNIKRSVVRIYISRMAGCLLTFMLVRRVNWR